MSQGGLNNWKPEAEKASLKWVKKMLLLNITTSVLLTISTFKLNIYSNFQLSIIQVAFYIISNFAE